MTSAISKTPPPPAVTQPAGPSPQKQNPAKTQADAATDSVHLSQTAQNAAAVLLEARETPAQTSQEASRGDLQARRLLAQEAAAKPVVK